jgi:hypothetical protein
VISFPCIIGANFYSILWQIGPLSEINHGNNVQYYRSGKQTPGMWTSAWYVWKYLSISDGGGSWGWNMGLMLKMAILGSL